MNIRKWSNPTLRLRRKKECKLRSLRKVAGFSAASLAERLDIAENTVLNWERAECVPNAIVMDEVCIMLNCRVVDIYPRP